MSPSPLDWRLVPAPDVSVVPVGDELVALAPDGRCHAVVNPGAMLWPLLDGHVTGYELAEDVADVFGVDPAEAEADLSAFAQSMVGLGLWTDVDGRHDRPVPLGRPHRHRAALELIPRWQPGLTLPGDVRPTVLACDDADLVAILSREFGGVPVGPGDHNFDFGLSVARRPGAGPRLIPELFAGASSILRSRSIARLMRILATRLAGRSADGSVGAPWATGIVHDGRAALIPREVLDRWTPGERQLAAAGAGIVDEPRVVVGDGGDAWLVVGSVPPSEVFDDELAVRPGRYPIAAIFWNEEFVGKEERASTGVGRFVELAEVDTPEVRRELLKVAPALAPTFHADPVERTVGDLERVLAALSPPRNP